MLKEQLAAFCFCLRIPFLSQKHFPPKLVQLFTELSFDWQISLQDDPAQSSEQVQLVGTRLHAASLAHAEQEQMNDDKLAAVRLFPEMSLGTWQTAPLNVTSGFPDNHIGSHLK